MKDMRRSCAAMLLAIAFAVAGCGGAGSDTPSISSGRSANDVVLPSSSSTLQFPSDFIWGSSTSAYQVEGARYDEKGNTLRAPTMFDYTAAYGIGESGDVSIDQYHRYKEDVALMALAGMKAYRFSISWPRLFLNSGGYPVKGSTSPTTGRFTPTLDAQGRYIPADPNPVAVAYYTNLINELKSHNIEPVITLFHWDLPISLEMVGAFDNRNMSDYFQEYSRTVFKLFGGKVKTWLTLNEPFSYTVLIKAMQSFARTGVDPMDITTYYGMDDGIGSGLARIHNYLLAHAKAVKVFRDMQAASEMPADAKIGFAVDLSVAKAASQDANDLAATKKYNDFKNGIFIDPLFSGKYPDGLLAAIKAYNNSYVLPLPDDQIQKDLAFMKENAGDFVGLNYYSRPIVSHLTEPGKLAAGAWRLGKAYPYDGVFMGDILVTSQFDKLADNNGAYDPQGLYDTLSWLDQRTHHRPILITENGTGNNSGSYNEDFIAKDGGVHDPLRTRFLKGHMEATWLALKNGINVIGYMAWSMFDNFEFSSYKPKFGLVYIDHNSDLKRIPKDSYYFYQGVAKSNSVRE